MRDTDLLVQVNNTIVATAGWLEIHTVHAHILFHGHIPGALDHTTIKAGLHTKLTQDFTENSAYVHIPKYSPTISQPKCKMLTNVKAKGRTSFPSLHKLGRFWTVVERKT